MNYSRLARKFCKQIKKYYLNLKDLETFRKEVNKEDMDNFDEYGFKKHHIRVQNHTTDFQLTETLKFNEEEYPKKTYYRDFSPLFLYQKENMEKESETLYKSLSEAKENGKDRSEIIKKIDDLHEKYEKLYEDNNYLDTINPNNVIDKLLQHVFYKKLGFNEEELPKNNIDKFIIYLKINDIIMTESKTEKEKIGWPYFRITDHLWDIIRKSPRGIKEKDKFITANLILSAKGMEIAEEPWILYAIKKSETFVWTTTIIGTATALSSLFKNLELEIDLFSLNTIIIIAYLIAAVLVLPNVNKKEIKQK